MSKSINNQYSTRINKDKWINWTLIGGLESSKFIYFYCSMASPSWLFELDPSHPRFWKPYHQRSFCYCNGLNWYWCTSKYLYRCNFKYRFSFIMNLVILVLVKFQVPLVLVLVYRIIPGHTDVTWKLAQNKETAHLVCLWSTLKIHRRSKKERRRKGGSRHRGPWNQKEKREKPRTSRALETQGEKLDTTKC